VRVTRGNTERYVTSRDRPPPHRHDLLAKPELIGLFAAVEASFSWTRGALAAHGWLDWVAHLPLETRVVLADGTRLLGVHASPGRDDGEGITPDRSEVALHDSLRGADADIVCAGHTHRATDRRVAKVRAVNLGSVSNPVTADVRACYVVIQADRHGHALEHRRVPYDRNRFLAALARSGHPEQNYIASFPHNEPIPP
jgi:Calcineurin-like phosphoesterase superfamily domain